MAYQQPQDPHQQQQQYYQQAPQGYSPSPPAQQVQQYAPPQDHQQHQLAQQQQYAHPQHQQTHVQQVVHQQYAAHPQMQPQFAQVANPKGWQTSLMDCSPLGSCCLATWLPCIRKLLDGETRRGTQLTRSLQSSARLPNANATRRFRRMTRSTRTV